MLIEDVKLTIGDNIEVPGSLSVQINVSVDKFMQSKVYIVGVGKDIFLQDAKLALNFGFKDYNTS
jgi:hypothetical protein